MRALGFRTFPPRAYLAAQAAAYQQHGQSSLPKTAISLKTRPQTLKTSTRRLHAVEPRTLTCPLLLQILQTSVVIWVKDHLETTGNFSDKSDASNAFMLLCTLMSLLRSGSNVSKVKYRSTFSPSALVSRVYSSPKTAIGRPVVEASANGPHTHEAMQGLLMQLLARCVGKQKTAISDTHVVGLPGFQLGKLAFACRHPSCA